MSHKDSVFSHTYLQDKDLLAPVWTAEDVIILDQRAQENGEKREERGEIKSLVINGVLRSKAKKKFREIHYESLEKLMFLDNILRIVGLLDDVRQEQGEMSLSFEHAQNVQFPIFFWEQEIVSPIN